MLRMESVSGFKKQTSKLLTRSHHDSARKSPTFLEASPHNFPAPGLNPWENLPESKVPNAAFQSSVVFAKFQ